MNYRNLEDDMGNIKINDYDDDLKNDENININQGLNIDNNRENNIEQ